MAKRLEWSDVNTSLDGKFSINSITSWTTDPESGEQVEHVEWFLSEGPLAAAPAPCSSLEEAKDLAQAIVNGPKALLAFEGKRAQIRAEGRTAVQAARRRERFAEFLDDPELMNAIADRLAPEVIARKLVEGNPTFAEAERLLDALTAKGDA